MKKEPDKKIRKVVGRPTVLSPLDRIWRLRQLARELGLHLDGKDDGEHIRKVVGRPR